MGKKFAGLALLIALAGCSPAAEEGVGGVSASEAQALNEAATLLEQKTGGMTGGNGGLNPAAISAVDADRGRQPAQ